MIVPDYVIWYAPGVRRLVVPYTPPTHKFDAIDRRPTIHPDTYEGDLVLVRFVITTRAPAPAPRVAAPPPNVRFGRARHVIVIGQTE